MNDNLKYNIQHALVRNCCVEEAKCEPRCLPAWQRTVLRDSENNVWYPLVAVNSACLKTMSKSKNGLIIDQKTGIWWVDEKLAKELNSKGATDIAKLSDTIRDRFEELSAKSASEPKEYDQ